MGNTGLKYPHLCAQPIDSLDENRDHLHVVDTYCSILLLIDEVGKGIFQLSNIQTVVNALVNQ